jgi:amino acid transporter
MKNKEKKQEKNVKKTEDTKNEETFRNKYSWIPIWGWVLIFLLPLLFSEYMFYVAGRIPTMVVFPFAWVGFWYFTFWQRRKDIFRKK